MIDIENDVFTAVATELRKRYKNIKVYGDEGTLVLATFPAVSMVETDNTTYLKSLTCDLAENHAELLYSVNIYSNKEIGKKAECKSIMATIDEMMMRFGFTRTFCSKVPNLQDGKIYRITARFHGVVGKDKKIYRS
ncbi:MAG: hypothetical protein RR841_08000 [Eubacterium sp.]